MGIMFISCRGTNNKNINIEKVCSIFSVDAVKHCTLKGRLGGAYVIGVRVGGVVQDDRLGQVPPQDAEVFDVVALNAGAILLIQTMPAGETQ